MLWAPVAARRAEIRAATNVSGAENVPRYSVQHRQNSPRPLRGAENVSRYSVQHRQNSPRPLRGALRRAGGGVAERSAFGGLASSKVQILKTLKLPEAAPRRRKCTTIFFTAPPKLPEAAPRRSPESWGGVAERSAFGGLASSKVGLLKKSGASEDFEDFEDFGTIKGVRAVSSRINPSEQYIRQV